MRFHPWYEKYEDFKNDVTNTEEFFSHRKNIKYTIHNNCKPLHEDSFLEDLKIVAKCRTLFYPGAGYDFSTVHFFFNLSLASKYYFCDYMNYEITGNSIFQELNSQLSPLGFLVQHIADLRPEYFNKKGWKRFWYDKKEARFGGDIEHSFVSLYRIIKSGREIMLYYFGTEAIQTYEVLLKNKISMDIMITQDHGLGGLWTTFCKDSLLEKCSIKHKMMPKFLLVGQNQEPWSAYEKITEPLGNFGLHQEKRILYKRVKI